MDRNVDRRATFADAEQSPLEHLLAVSSGKPFDNLSWRLLKLLIEGVRVERRALGDGDTLKISTKIDAIRVERGSLRLREDPDANTNPPKVPPAPMWTHPRELMAGTTGIPVDGGKSSKYNGTTAVMSGGVYEALEDTVVRLFSGQSL